LIYLDTHVVVWLYAGLENKFTPFAKTLINHHDLLISPVVRLELQYLYEIQRLTEPANTIVADLVSRIGLRSCEKPFNAVVDQALTIGWTRDPFDRLLVAHAGLNQNVLLTKDTTILTHYALAKWEEEATANDRSPQSPSTSTA